MAPLKVNVILAKTYNAHTYSIETFAQTLQGWAHVVDTVLCDDGGELDVVAAVLQLLETPLSVRPKTKRHDRRVDLGAQFELQVTDCIALKSQIPS